MDRIRIALAAAAYRRMEDAFQRSAAALALYDYRAAERASRTAGLWCAVMMLVGPRS